VPRLSAVPGSECTSHSRLHFREVSLAVDSRTVIGDDVAGVVLPFAVPCETFVPDHLSLVINWDDPAARKMDPS
jgi:hypothetical protein